MPRETQWQFTGDLDWLTYDGAWYRRVGRRSKRRYQFVVFTNMDQNCGRDNEGQDPYVVELREVHLASIDAATLKGALDCCGAEAGSGDAELAYCCNSYGAYAPMGSWSGRNAYALLRAARAEAASLRAAWIK